MTDRSPAGAGRLDFMAALRFAFDDEHRFEKLGLGALLSMVPVLNIALVGYQVTLIRNVCDGAPRPLPEWRDVSGLWWTGLPLAGALWIYAAPILLAMGGGTLFTVAAIAVAQAGGDPWIALGAVVVVGVVVLLFVSAYALVMTVVGPTVTLQYAEVGSFGACFEFAAMLAVVRERFSSYATLWIALFVGRSALSAVVSPVMSALSAIPVFGQLLAVALAAVAFLWLGLAGAHLEGQILRNAVTEWVPGADGTAAAGPPRGPDRSAPPATGASGTTVAGTTPAPSRG